MYKTEKSSLGIHYLLFIVFYQQHVVDNKPFMIYTFQLSRICKLTRVKAKGKSILFHFKLWLHNWIQKQFYFPSFCPQTLDLFFGFKNTKQVRHQIPSPPFFLVYKPSTPCLLYLAIFSSLLRITQGSCFSSSLLLSGFVKFALLAFLCSASWFLLSQTWIKKCLLHIKLLMIYCIFIHSFIYLLSIYFVTHTCQRVLCELGIT